MNPLALWLHVFALCAAMVDRPRELPEGVIDIREGHAIRARRARRAERRL